MDGDGELTLSDGRVAKATWAAGKLVGDGVLLLPTGGRYDGGLEALPDGNVVPSGRGHAVAAPQGSSCPTASTRRGPGTR